MYLVAVLLELRGSSAYTIGTDPAFHQQNFCRWSFYNPLGLLEHADEFAA